MAFSVEFVEFDTTTDSFQILPSLKKKGFVCQIIKIWLELGHPDLYSYKNRNNIPTATVEIQIIHVGSKKQTFI